MSLHGIFVSLSSKNIGKVGMLREEDEQRRAAATRNEKQPVNDNILCLKHNYYA